MMIFCGKYKCPKLKNQSGSLIGKECSCTPNGRIVATLYFGNLSIFDTKTATWVRTIRPLMEIVQFLFLDNLSLCYSELEAVGKDLYIRIYIIEIITGEVLKSFVIPDGRIGGNHKYYVIHSMNNGDIALVGYKNIILNGNGRDLSFANKSLSEVVFSHSGMYVYFILEKKVHVWNIQTNSQVTKVNVPDIKKIAPGQNDDQLILFGNKQIFFIFLKDPKANFAITAPYLYSPSNVSLFNDTLYLLEKPDLYILSGFKYTTIEKHEFSWEMNLAFSTNYLFVDDRNYITIYKIPSQIDVKAFQPSFWGNCAFQFLQYDRKCNNSLEPVDGDNLSESE